ncbi:MAG: nucleoside-diphosphate kinase [Firmicutes bacterium]|jgi:nucleoside-diphosphate kinase|nr:nucleoside-diphosphate kinase [Bacillota bacterium]
MERTCIIIKPDGVSRGLVGEIVSRFERRGFRVANARALVMTDDLVAEHYAHLVSEAFFPEIRAYMTSGPVLAMVLEAPNAVEAARQMVGATDPMKAAPGTIRGDLATSLRFNLVHASDSPSSAAVEINRFFPSEDPRKESGYAATS